MAEYDPKWDEITVDLTLTEAELRTIATALNSYGHAISQRLSHVLQDGILDHMGYVREPTKKELKDARRAIDRAFDLQQKLVKYYRDDGV